MSWGCDNGCGNLRKSGSLVFKVELYFVYQGFEFSRAVNDSKNFDSVGCGPEKYQVIPIWLDSRDSHSIESWVWRNPTPADAWSIKQRPDRSFDCVQNIFRRLGTSRVDKAVNFDDIIAHLGGAADIPAHRLVFAGLTAARAALRMEAQSALSITLVAPLRTASISLSSILRRASRSAHGEAYRANIRWRCHIRLPGLVRQPNASGLRGEIHSSWLA